MSGTVDQIEARAREIVDPARSYESASECGKLAREALALVEVARALEEVARAAQALMAVDDDMPTLLGDETYSEWARRRLVAHAALRAALSGLEVASD